MIPSVQLVCTGLIDTRFVCIELFPVAIVIYLSKYSIAWSAALVYDVIHKCLTLKTGIYPREGQISIADWDKGVKLVSTFCYSSESDNTEAVCLCLASLHDYLQQSILTFAEAAFEPRYRVKRLLWKTSLKVLPWSEWEENVVLWVCVVMQH